MTLRLGTAIEMEVPQQLDRTGPWSDATTEENEASGGEGPPYTGMTPGHLQEAPKSVTAFHHRTQRQKSCIVGGQFLTTCILQRSLIEVSDGP